MGQRKLVRCPGTDSLCWKVSHQAGLVPLATLRMLWEQSRGALICLVGQYLEVPQASCLYGMVQKYPLSPDIPQHGPPSHLDFSALAFPQHLDNTLYTFSIISHSDVIDSSP